MKAKTRKRSRKRYKSFTDGTPSRHHICPRSRSGGLGENIATIETGEHRAYHKLFSNMTPDEIIAHLVKYYWNNQWKWVELALLQKGEENDQLENT